MTVVIAQSANAFACRSTTRPAWRIGWLSNRFLIASVAVELAFAIVVVATPAAASLLDHRWPPAAAWTVVLLSAPAMLLVDGAWKHRNRPEHSPRATSLAGAVPVASRRPARSS
jgi:magnesium-transporting ATPase (P-type)